MASKFGGIPVTGSRFGGVPVTGSRPVVIPEEEDDRTLGDSVNDFVANFGVGSGQIVGLLGSAYGLATGDMENRLTQTGARTSKFWEERRTPAYLEAERSRQAKVDAAEGEFKKAGVAMWETVTNPMLLVGELAKQAPNLALGGVGGAVGKVATASTAKVLGREVSEQGLVRAGTTAATGTGVGLSSADFGQSAYEQLMSLPDEVWLANPQVQERIGDNMDLLPQVKREIATGLAQNSAIAGGLVTYGLNKLPGAKTIEKALGGEALTGTRLRRAAAGLAGETLSEGLEEGATQLTANIAQSQIDPNTRLSTGLGQAAGLGAVTGGGLGLITGALTPGREAVAAEDEALKFGNPPPAPAEVSPDQVISFARTRLEELTAKSKGTAATEIVDPATGQTVISPGRPAEFLSDNEKAELEFLVNNVSNLEAIGTAYNLKVKVAAEQRLNEATSAADAVQAAADMVDTDIEALEREAGIGSTVAPVVSTTVPVAPVTSALAPEVSPAAPQGQGLLAQAMAPTPSVEPTLTLETLTQADISTMPAPERQEFLDDLTAARTANLPVQREQALRRAAETYGRTVGPVQQPLPSVTPQEAIARAQEATVRAQDLPQERSRTAAPNLDALMAADTRGMDLQDREDFNANLAMARSNQPGPVQTAALQRAAEVYGRAVGPVQTRAPAAQTTAPRVEVPRPSRLLGKATELYSETDLETLISNNKVPAVTRRGAEVELRARRIPPAPQVQETVTDENFISIPETVPDVAVQPVAGQSAGDAARATAQRAMDTWAASQGTASPIAFGAPSAELEASVAEITDLIGSQWGGRVVAFSDPRPKAMNGVAIGEVAYVNVSDNQAGVQRTALHEFKHTVEQIAKAEAAAGMTDTPAQEFVDQIDSVFDDITEEGKRAYLENYIAADELAALEGEARETRMQELLQDPELRSEMVADFLGNRATDKKFWQDLAKADPTGFEGFVTRWLAAIDNLLATLRGAKNRSRTESARVDSYIRDLNKAKMVAQSALINYRKSTGAAPVQAAPVQGQAAFSRTQPLVDTSSLDAASKLARSQDWRRGRDFKVALQRQVLDAGMAEGIDATQDTPETRKYLLEVGLRDAIAALKQNANAIGWYDTKTRQALAVMSLVHPEIARDEDARFAFTWALAVTSNGLKVGKNFELAERAYSEYKRTGVMPNNVGVGTAGSKINDALELFNTLRDEWGMENLRNFMQSNFTVSEISGISKALKPSGEHAEVTVKGAAILGPKIGNGFFSNLYGNFDSLTMDRWLIRTWGRWTGTLIKAMPEQTAKARARLQNTVRLVLANPAEAKRLSGLLGEEITDDVDALAGAVQIASMDPKIRSALNKTEVGQELRKAGNSLAKYLDGQKEAPQNPDERKYIRAVFGDILNDLRQTDAYKDLTMADLQAVLWYAEKRLYETAKEDPQELEADEDVEGYADDSAPDYANAAASVAREKGITDRRINAALKRVEDERSGRARPAAAGSDAQGQVVGAGEQAAPGGFTRQERRKFIGERAVLRARADRAGDAQQPRAYSGDGGANGGRVRLLKTLGVKYTQIWKASRNLGTVFRSNDLATPEFFELAPTAENAAKFQQAIAENKAAHPFGAAVYVYPAEDYQQMRLFLTRDGRSGVAVKPDGDIVSVFSTGGAGRAIMELAVSAGGRKLDAFDTILPEFYAPHGFRAVARTRWNDEFAPDEWSKETFREFNSGEPDVVFMVYDPAKVDAEYSRKDGRVMQEYDRAVALQNREAKRLAPQFSRQQGDVLARDPRLEQAARGMKEGTVTSAEYNELVDAIKPVTPYTEAPEPATPADIRRALTSDKLDRIGVPSKTLKAGDPVGLRLDIPAYANHGVWVVSVHDQIPGFAAGKSIGYESVASVTNPTFGVVESAALNIASGKPKATIAVMKGDWKPITPKQAAAAAKLAMGSKSWVQVGMDPTRHAYFYDRASMEPVVSADEAIQVGPLVLAKNPVYGNKEDFRFSRSQTDTPAFKRWFGDSKVVDKNGQPLMVYHGTRADFSEFSQEFAGSAMSGEARDGFFFTSDPAEASDYVSGTAPGGQVMPVFLAIQNPFEVSFAEHRIGDIIEADEQVARYLRRAQGFASKLRGKDGLILRGVGGNAGKDLYVAFRPDQIKSAIGNTGAFDPGTPDIRFSQAQKSPLKLYSALARAAEAGPTKGQAQQWKGFLRNQKGVTPEEIEWSGVEDWLDTQDGAITREQVGTFLAENGVQVGEVVLGKSGEVYPDDFWRSPFNGNEMSYDDWVQELEESGEDPEEAFATSLVPIGGTPRATNGDTKYEKYTVPGGENYREILLTLPTASVPGVAGEVTFPDEDSVDDFLTTLSVEGFESLDYGATEDEAGDRKVVVFEGLAKNERTEFDSFARDYGGTVRLIDGSSPALLYRHSHWREGNVLAHIRLKDRLDENGDEVLFVEEVQSDWGQEGRERGFLKGDLVDQPMVAKIARDEYGNPHWRVTTESGLLVKNIYGVKAVEGNEDEAIASAKDYVRMEGNNPIGRPVPAAPFVQTTGGWLNLALKRVIAVAVEQGYDKVAFVSGEQSAKHYDLAQQVSAIELESPLGSLQGEDFSTGYLTVFDLEGNEIVDVSGKVTSPEQIAERVGKEVAQKLLDAEPRGMAGRFRTKTLAGEGLTVGGEGMKAFYDFIIPKTLNKLLPKLGGKKVETVEIDVPTKNRAKEPFKKISAMGFSITPEMKDQVMDAGLPMFSRAQNIFGKPMPTGTWQVEDSVLDTKVIYNLQDKFVDTKRVVEAINGAVGQIEDKWDPYLQEKMYHGVVAKQTKDFAEKELKPLIETMGRNKVTLEDFDKYLHNRHAQERNIAIAQRNLALPDAGSGIATADAQAYLAALPAARRVLLEGLARKIDSITKGTRDILVASGLEAQSTIDAWDGAYKKYVPLMREELDYEGSSGASTGRGVSVSGSSSRRAVGSADRTVVDIMANIAMQRERAIVRAAKNKVSQGLYGLALKNPSPGFWLPINPDAIKDPQALVAELINFGVDPLEAKNIAEEPRESYVDSRTGLVSTRVNRRLRTLPNVVYTRVNGKDRFLIFNPKAPRAERMAKALNGLDVDSVYAALTMAAIGTRWFASVNTQYNPIFGVINLSRDLGAGALNLTTTPLADKKAEVIANSIPALRGIYRSVRGKSSQNQWAALWEEFQQVGGQTGFRDQFSQSEERARALQSELDNLSAGNLKKAVQGTLSWLSDYNTSMENAVRLSAYKSALDIGMTKQRAAELAKDLTVNFNKKGAIATNMGALYAFFNASVQGTTRLAQTLKGPAGKKIVYGGLLLGAVQAVALMAAGFEDDEPPGFIKERNLVIPIGDGKYLTWPMPLGFNVIPNVGRIATEWALSGFERTPDRTIEMATSFFDMFNPIGNAGWSGQTFAPTVADPFVALWENKDWTGTPISREDLNSLAPTPGYLRARDSASWLATELAHFFNLASGGTDFTPGKFSPTPEQLEYLGGQITGGVGREAGKFVKTAELLATGEDLPPYAIPLAGRLYGENTGSAAESNRFYENIRQMNLHNNELRGLRETQQPTGEYLRENPEARLATQASRVYRQVQNMRKRKREMLDRNASRESIRLIEQQITNRMKQFNDRMSRIES